MRPGGQFQQGLLRELADQTAPATRHIDQRLQELQQLLDAGLIQRPEYERKRAEILKNL